MLPQMLPEDRSVSGPEAVPPARVFGRPVSPCLPIPVLLPVPEPPSRLLGWRGSQSRGAEGNGCGPFIFRRGP